MTAVRRTTSGTRSDVNRSWSIAGVPPLPGAGRGVGGQLRLQPGLHRRPFVVEDAVKDRVTQGAVVQQHVLAQDALAHGAQPFDGRLRLEVAAVRLELD